MIDMASYGLDKVDETMVLIFDWDNTPLRKREFDTRIQQAECEEHECLAGELVVRVVRMKAQGPKWGTAGLCNLNRLRGETFQAARGRVSKDSCWLTISFEPWCCGSFNQPPAMLCSPNLCD